MGKVSCSRKQRGALMGLEPTTSTLILANGDDCVVCVHYLETTWRITWVLNCLKDTRTCMLCERFGVGQNIKVSCVLKLAWSWA